MGKTTIGRVIALSQIFSGWEALECRSPAEVLKMYRADLRQVFVADVFFGNVVPYHHLELAEFESAQNEEVITLLFLNRTVRIKGGNLRTLGEALQERTVESITPLPERFLPLVSGEVRVKVIEITNNKQQS
jgi:hypothetical protein